ncbi:sensor histidine kinase [Sulfitobacter dubius]|uniref:sensor histidine kinase n=1 Tax=Sulfitobacter dubius TaxID=218673 RepID=UPI002943EBE9|nr:ATP-binding protein [Sulfitobacter dubius]WOI30781.1 ATP-binding protein [Sulfitobacter dubius]
MLTSHKKLSLQIASSLFIVFGAGLLSLIFVGGNAIRMGDESALARQKRFASRPLAEAVAAIPDQQRSATVWDDAIVNAVARNEEWLDDNLGGWMQDYFGHHENYVLTHTGDPIFASVQGKVRSPEAFSSRANFIAPVVARLREVMAKVSLGQNNPYEALAEVAIVTPLELDDQVAIVSVVPIISETGDIMQVPGTEYLHVTVRYIDEDLAHEVGLPIELGNVAFNASAPTGELTGLPLKGPSGDVLAWLVWNPERPGTDLFAKLLPILLVVGLMGGVFLMLIVRRLLRVSGELQTSEEQALMDVKALKQAKIAAEAADRAKVNFMSIVSHELRTPLTVILGYARLGKNLRQMPSAKRLDVLLQQRDIDATLVRGSVDELIQSGTTGMEKISRSGEHLLFLVNQLLDYAKMETGRLEVDPVVCDVQEVLEPVLDQMKILTEQKGLELEAEIPSHLMIADVTRTRQIIINLMGNAIKFTDSGKVSVVVTDSEQKVHIDVRDTGTGIEPHELEKIFEAFHQADLSSSRSAAGTGLGLSVARELARLENGSIDVRSKLGVGSVFTLSLPKETPETLKEAA